MEKMKTFFILGNHPAISTAEIIRKFSLRESNIVAVSDDFLIVDIPVKPTIQHELGGIIKMGEIISSYKNDRMIDRRYGLQTVPTDILVDILQSEQKNHVSKFHFGISVYGKKIDPHELCALGKEIKNELKSFGSVRFVRTQNGQTLSSVVVQKNGLISDISRDGLQTIPTRGLELCVLYGQDEVYIGKTMAVQDFEGLSRRDYGRPYRDDYSGMIPPKLAQMMINIAAVSKDAVIYDPFCGSGTIVHEALLMGYKNVIGSDNSEKAVEDSKKNIAWLKKEFGFSGNVHIFHADARNVNIQHLVGTRFILPVGRHGAYPDAIITEPYLGKQRGRNIQQEIPILEALYSQSLENLQKILKKDGIIVMIWPVFVENGKKYFLFENTRNFVGSGLSAMSSSRRRVLDVEARPNGHALNLQIMDVLPPKIKNIYEKYLSERGNMLYGRPGQGVMREVVIFSYETKNDIRRRLS